MSKQDLLNEILSEMHTECKRLIEHLASSEDVSIERIEASFRQMMLRIGGKFIELYIRRSDLGYDGSGRSAHVVRWLSSRGTGPGRSRQ